MNRSRLRFWLLAYHSFAGSCDTLTGLLLLIAPGWTLAQMGIQNGPQPLAFAGFIGAFVLAVGSAYLYAVRIPMDAANAPAWQTVWLLTALSRTCVAGFLTWQVVRGRMEPSWKSVALTDGAIAAFQWIGLGKGWLRFPG